MMQAIPSALALFLAIALLGCGGSPKPSHFDEHWNTEHDDFQWSTDPATYLRELALAEKLLLQEIQGSRVDLDKLYLGILLGRDRNWHDPPPEIMKNLAAMGFEIQPVSNAPKENRTIRYVHLRRRVRQFSICVNHGLMCGELCGGGEIGAIYYHTGTIWKLRVEGSQWVSQCDHFLRRRPHIDCLDIFLLATRHDFHSMRYKMPSIAIRGCHVPAS